MSRTIQAEIKCWVCGKYSEQRILVSISRFGAPDLDLRPPEMDRSAKKYTIQECPHCGYVAIDISRKTTISKDWLKNTKYLLCDNRFFKSEFAKKFYKNYLTNSIIGNIESAYCAVLNAAWECDDVGDVDNAFYCRKKALEEIDKLIASSGKEIFVVVKADLLRRTDQFEILIEEYKEKVFSEEMFNKVIAFQIDKARAQDAHRYTVANVN